MKRIVKVDNKKYTVERESLFDSKGNISNYRYFVKIRLYGSKKLNHNITGFYWRYISDIVSIVSIYDKELYNKCIEEFKKVINKS